MARPKKLEPASEMMMSDPYPPSAPTVAYVEAKPSKVLCKAFHMVVGVDLIGAKTSLSTSKNMELEVTPLGIKAYSKNSNRTVLIPWTNIKGAELL